LAGTLYAHAAADPGVVWQAVGATALFVGALGTIGYSIQADPSAGYRVLFFLVLGLIVYGFVTLFVSMPAANVIYAVLGLVIFGGYTILDFNRLRQAVSDDVVWIASGIFLDVLTIFTFLLQLFDRGRN
jgi:FtsH-binding integral membrane protein